MRTKQNSPTNKGRFCYNSKIDTNFKAIICREQSEPLSTWNSKHLLISIVYLQFLVERVSLCSLQIIALKLVCLFRYCHKICLPLLVEGVLICSLQIIVLKLVCLFRYCHKICLPLLVEGVSICSLQIIALKLVSISLLLQNLPLFYSLLSDPILIVIYFL